MSLKQVRKTSAASMLILLTGQTAYIPNLDPMADGSAAPQRKKATAADDEESDADDGPTFGNMDIKAPEGASDDEDDFEGGELGLAIDCPIFIRLSTFKGRARSTAFENPASQHLSTLS